MILLILNNINDNKNDNDDENINELKKQLLKLKKNNKQRRLYNYTLTKYFFWCLKLDYKILFK